MPEIEIEIEMGDRGMRLQREALDELSFLWYRLP